MVEARGGDELCERLHGVLLEAGDALCLVGNDNRALSQVVLSGNAGRAAIGMAALRLPEILKTLAE
jgi:hypothetical protein